MALARIITRSQACSRELALDLLARGYAVEIVSPDRVPDNLADLELRVDTTPGDQLIASVEAHNGGRSASLEFLHHLKAPMADFIRRPPQPRGALHLAEVPVSFNAESSIENVEVPADAPQRAPKFVSPAAEILLDPQLDPKEDVRPVVPLVTRDPLPSPPLEPPSYFPVEDPIVAKPTMVRPAMVRPGPQRRDRPAGWRWRAVLTFASVVLLALFFGFGMRRTGNAAGPSSGVVPAEKVAASPTDVDLLSAVSSEKGSEKDSRPLPTVAASPTATKSEGKSDHAPKKSPVANAGTATASAMTATNGSSISHRRGDDLVAADTVTYLDNRFDKRASKDKPANHFARRNPSSRKHDGRVIAANTVTYLDKKPTPKAAKPDSSIKHHSDLN
jgi:hypothetical protein